MDVVPKHPTRTLVSSVEAFPGPGRRFFSYTWLENEEYYFAIVDAQVPHDIPLGQHLPNETPLDVYSLRGCHLPKNRIFATMPHDLQIAKPEDVQSSDIFIKKPQIVMSDENEDISKMQPITEGLIPEARVYETLMSVSGGPHPNICRYYGAVETDGFLCGLALQRCRKTLQELKTENAVFDEAFIERVASGLRAALTHLHSINLAHVRRSDAPSHCCSLFLRTNRMTSTRGILVSMTRTTLSYSTTMLACRLGRP